MNQQHHYCPPPPSSTKLTQAKQIVVESFACSGFALAPPIFATCHLTNTHLQASLYLHLCLSSYLQLHSLFLLRARWPPIAICSATNNADIAAV